MQGSQRAARAWLLTPARSLDAARPVELLTTAQGTEAVLEHLQRLALNAYV
ncbi:MULTISPECIES: MbcA/ParS/Xre antitoxin family protein [unclassified Roseateles]|uniref:antitoxin Xre/MbcA/ParS toxin-binding domain-containing protein n=1 Tax=unclassified Roseateles TaxID=2626991 RepID=UPI00160E4CDC